MIMKKAICSILSVVMALSIMPVITITGSAENVCVGSTIDSFGADTQLSPMQFDILKNGSFSASKINGKWYYVFNKDGNIVNVKASAFKGKAANGKNLEEANKKLTSNVMSTSGIGSTGNFIFQKNLKSVQKEVACKPVNGGGPKKETMTTYQTYLWNAAVTGYRNGAGVQLECTEAGNVLFSFSDHTDRVTKEEGGYHKLKTAKDYEMALARSVNANLAITPTFTLKVVKPGTSKVCIYQMEYRGKGLADTTVNAASLINILSSAKQVAASKTPVGAVKSLYSVIEQTINLVPKSSEYVNNKTIKLSDYDRKIFTYKADATSPIKLAAAGDYFRAEIALNKEPTASSDNGKVITQLKAELQFS